MDRKTLAIQRSILAIQRQLGDKSLSLTYRNKLQTELQKELQELQELQNRLLSEGSDIPIYGGSNLKIKQTISDKSISTTNLLKEIQEIDKACCRFEEEQIAVDGKLAQILSRESNTLNSGGSNLKTEQTISDKSISTTNYSKEIEEINKACCIFEEKQIAADKKLAIQKQIAADEELAKELS